MRKSLIAAAAIAATLALGTVGCGDLSEPTPASGVANTSDNGNAASADMYRVTYRIIGDAASTDVTYVSDLENGQISQHQGVSMPWEKTVKAPHGMFAGVATLNAQNGQNDGEITCEIAVDGKIVQRNTSTGAFAMVDCTYTIS